MRDIAHHLRKTLDVELSSATITPGSPTRCAGAVMAWQSRPLEDFYPVVYLDAIRVKVPQWHKVSNRAAHIAIGAGHGGRQARSGHLGPGR